MRILFVDDAESSLEQISNALDELNDYDIQPVYAKTEADALEKIELVDAALIDVSLTGASGREGVTILKRIQERNSRIPCAFFTATSDQIDSDLPFFKCYLRDDSKYIDAIKDLYHVSSAGFVEVFGSKGILEQEIWNVYAKVLLPHALLWANHSKSSPNLTKNALIRVSLAHLSKILDLKDSKRFVEEFFIHKANGQSWTTGELVALKPRRKKFIILTPSCDLVLRPNGLRNVSNALLCEIESDEIYINKARSKTNLIERKIFIEEVARNKNKQSQHFLPHHPAFEGGFANFNSLQSVDFITLTRDYESLNLVAAPEFLKEIQSRFSSYLARAGQPEINVDAILERL